MMRATILVTAVLFTVACVSEASAQTAAPTPTPRPAIRIPGRPRPSTGTSGSTTSTQAPGGDQQKTLICRMGGNMVWTLVNQFELVQTQINGKNVRVPVVAALFDQLKFASSAEVVQPDASNLPPGFCGFSNRAMTSADPDTVVADADNFTINETVLWGNGSTIKGETTMSGGMLSFQNKQAFSMPVMLWSGVQWKVARGTQPKVLN